MSSQALAIRALLWKEWRQQRALFGILVGAGLLAILSGFWWRPFYAVGLAATLVWGCGPLLFASNVFAGETDAGTKDFLDGLPCSRAHVFRAKFAAAFALGLVGSLAVLIPGTIFLHVVANDRVAANELLPMLVLVVVVVVTEVSLAAVMASFDGTAMVTVLTSMVLTLGFSITQWGVFRWNGGFSPSDSWGTIGTATIVMLLLAAGAESCYTGRRSGLLLAAWRASKTLAVPVLLILTIVTSTWWWNSTPRNRGAAWLAYGTTVGSAPSGHVALQFGRTRMWRSGRTAFLDVSTGKARTFSRLSLSNVVGTHPWSPDGKRCLLTKDGVSMKPFLHPKPEQKELWVFHSDTRGFELLSTDPVVMKGRPVWLDNKTVTARIGGDDVRFLPVDGGAESLCLGPPPKSFKWQKKNTVVVGTSWDYHYGRLASQGVGVFLTTVFVTDGSATGITLAIHRYSPSLSSSETREFSLPTDWLCGINVLPDGDTFAVWDEKRLFLASFRSGTWEEGTLPSSAGGLLPTTCTTCEKHVLSLSPATCGKHVFVPGRTGALPSACFVTTERAIYVHHLDTNSWDTWPLPEKWLKVARDNPSKDVPPLVAFPSPDGARLLVTQPLKGGLAAVLDPGGGEWSQTLTRHVSRISWFGNDQLVTVMRDEIWLLDRDMEKRRRVFPR